MPIYEYECQKCEKLFEYMQGINEAAKTECEECAGQLTKLISASGFILKGGGWYKDLYSSSKPASSGESSSQEGKSDKGKTDKGKTDKSKTDKSKTAGSTDKSSSSTKSVSPSSSSGNKRAG